MIAIAEPNGARAAMTSRNRWKGATAAALLFAVLGWFGATPSMARGGHGGGNRQGSGTHLGRGGIRSHAPGIPRVRHQRVRRSARAKDAFRRTHPCPSTGRTSGACPGYVIDHVRPLKRGGADDPSNMQWQTLPEAKAKDRWE